MRFPTLNKHWALLVFLTFAGLNLAACSNGNQEPAEKSAVDKAIDQAATKAEETIRTPMDKAKQTMDLGNQRLEEMDKAVAGQEQGGEVSQEGTKNPHP